jgi:hypothetical protein
MDCSPETSRYVYLVRPKGDLWELSFAAGTENGVLFATQREAVSQADALARGRWESRGESSGVRVEIPGAEPTFRATYGIEAEPQRGE